MIACDEWLPPHSWQESIFVHCFTVGLGRTTKNNPPLFSKETSFKFGAFNFLQKFSAFSIKQETSYEQSD